MVASDSPNERVAWMRRPRPIIVQVREIHDVRRTLKRLRDIPTPLFVLWESNNQRIVHQNHVALFTTLRSGRPAAKARQLSSMIS